MKRSSKPKPLPTTRAGWAAYYVTEFNKHGRDSSAVMAMWYMLLELGLEGK